MNEIVNKFLLVGDKFMPEMRLRQPGFTYSACGPFTRNKERIGNVFISSAKISSSFKTVDLFLFVDMFIKLYLTSVLHKCLPCLNKNELNII